MCTFLIFFVCAHSYHPTSYFLFLHFSLTLLSHSPLSLSTLHSHLLLNKNLSYIACGLLFFCTFTRSNNNCKQKDLKYNGKQFS